MIQASDFYDYAECPRRVYLNAHGDKEAKKEHSNFREKLIADSRSHQKAVLDEKTFAEVSYANSDDGFKMTYYLMSTGTPLIHNGVLKYNGMKGKPDLLIKVKGRSRFGSHHYTPCSITSSKQLKEHHRMKLMFYSYLLSQVQGHFPSSSSIINKDKKDIVFKTSDEKKYFEKKLQNIKDIKEGKTSFDPVIIPACAKCNWKDFCMEEAIKKKDLSLVYKMSRDERDLLISKGVTDLRALVMADTAKLARNKSLKDTIINRWKIQAKALLTEKPIILKAPKLEKAKVEIFFDIESHNDQDYLLGLLIRRGKNERYQSFWSNGDEEHMFKDFCKYLEGLKEFTIYHYSPYEKKALKRMAKDYKASKRLMKNIEENLVDLFPILNKSAILPITSYALKPVAKHLGHTWADEDTDAKQSLYWYEQWQKSKETEYQEKIIQYNKNDCEALLLLKDWLSALE